MTNVIKNLIERALHCHIYRNTIPRGTKMYADLDRAFGLGNFRRVFDVGANVGHVSLDYARHFPQAQIYAFEPVAATYAKLEAGVRGHERILPFGLGMGHSPGEATIHLYPESLLNSIRHAPAGKPGDGEAKEKIRIESLDNFCALHRIGSIDFLKIDTEGYELEVLAGARTLLQTGAIGLILLESEPSDSKTRFVPLAELARYLAQWGYECFGIYDQMPGNEKRTVQYFNVLFASDAFSDPRFNLGDRTPGEARKDD